MHKETQKSNIRYANINVSKFSQFELKKEFNKDSKPSINFKTNFKFKVLLEKNLLICITSVNVSIIETGELYSELVVENEFEVKPLSKILKRDEDKYFNIPVEILRTILSFSTSTLRGILFEKSKGTIIQNEIYPLFDPSTILKD